MSMTHAEEFSADLARAANLNFRLAELLEQHGTAAVLGALATACQSAAETATGEGHHRWIDAASKMRKARTWVGIAETHGITLGDACRVQADVELGE